MTQWYIKELSLLTHISVQTLHHYDRIGLLKPSVRSASGYRLYSEKDLLKLQQILALKFFGFKLAQIKTLLAGKVEMRDHFAVQSQFLEEKAKTLLSANDILKKMISDNDDNKSIPWKTIIHLIEAYRMTQDLENTWAGKVLTPEELKQYATLRQSLTENEAQAFHQAWIHIVAEANASTHTDPTSEKAMALGKQAMDRVNRLYGKKHVALRNAMWEKGFKQGKVDVEPTLTAEGVAWLDKAIEAYYDKQISDLFAQVGKQSDAAVSASWEEVLTDLFGDDKTLRKNFLEGVLKDPRTTQAIKTWLKKHSS